MSNYLIVPTPFLSLLLVFMLGGSSSKLQAQTDCSVQTDIPQIECETLLAFHASTNGSSWTNSVGWTVDNSPCTWNGVVCNGGVVQFFSLTSNQLSGTIPVEIGNLTNLINLALSSNQLTGPIPSSIGDLDNLKILNLAANKLEGPLPSEIGDLQSLETLNLFDNLISGSIPPQIGNLPQIKTITLTKNQLSGDIPPEIGDLSTLRELNLTQNSLDGPIPSTLENLSQLTHLLLGQNNLGGGIPSEIGSMLSLRIINLDSNPLGGSIPPELGNITFLDQLHLNFAQLTGSIPPELGDLQSLRWLLLIGNELSGEIPVELSELQTPLQGNAVGSLDRLFLRDNDLQGIVPLEIAQMGAGLGICQFTGNTTSLCIPDTADYQAIGVNPICGLPLSASCQPLPVELASFKARSRADVVTLEWMTASERANQGFEIEHRSERDWKYIGFVNGQGDSDVENFYEYEVAGLDPGRHFFRLRQIDFDGAFEYSHEVENEILPRGGFAIGDVFPNPSRGQASFVVTSTNQQEVVVTLIDALGRRVKIIFEGRIEGRMMISFSNSNLPSGSYQLLVESEIGSDSRSIFVLP